MPRADPSEEQKNPRGSKESWYLPPQGLLLEGAGQAERETPFEIIVYQLKNKTLKLLNQTPIYQDLFCHDQVSSGKFLAFFLLRNLHIFLDTIEPRRENKNSSLENCFDNEGSVMWKKLPKSSIKLH